MKKFPLTIFALITYISAVAQTIFGDWIATSISVDDSMNVSRELLVKEDKVRFTFNPDGSYTKSFYVPKASSNRPLYKDFELSEGRIEKKRFYDEHGELKMMVVSEEVEKGQYQIDSAKGTILFESESGTYLSTFKHVDSGLLIKEADNTPLYITLVMDKKKKKRVNR